MMARTAYRVMSLEARGLLYSLRLECWVNGSVPADPRTLARVLGYGVEQIEAALPEVMPLFMTEGGAIRCPELDDYRTHLDDRRMRQSAGGKAGAAKTNGARSGSKAATPPGSPRLTRDSLVKPRPVQNSQALKGGSSPDAWLNDYERASRGA